MNEHDGEDKDLEKGTSPQTSSSSLHIDDHMMTLPVPQTPVDEVVKGPLPFSDDSISTHEKQSGRPESLGSVASEIREPSYVERSNRRGLLARVTVVAEVEEPVTYARRTKWFITFIVAVAGSAAPMGSSVILPALADITRVFDTTDTVANLSVAFYMLSMSIFPLWWSSFSETLGRRTIYISSFFLFAVFNILSAVSTSISMFIVMRIFSGGAAASVQAVGAGTIADIWEVKERGRAMGFFYLGPLCGPLISPIVGGALAESLGWRSDMWFMVIFGIAIEVFIIFFLPETLKRERSIIAEAEQEVIADEKDSPSPEVRPTLTRTTTKQSIKTVKSVAHKTKTYAAALRRCFVDPLAIILNLRSPAVAITVYYASITFGCLYVLNISVQQTFSAAPYNFSTIIVGLLYLPNSLGYFAMSLIGGRWIDKIMHREARRANRYDAHGKLIFQPEDRLRENAWLGAIMYPSALIWYGWCANYGEFWFATLIANFFFGVGSMVIFGAVTTMLTEFMPRKASHGIALNNFVRNIFSCVGTLVAAPWIDAIGNGWVFTILGLWCLVSGCLVVWGLRHFGPRWRAHSEKRGSI